MFLARPAVRWVLRVCGAIKLTCGPPTLACREMMGLCHDGRRWGGGGARGGLGCGWRLNSRCYAPQTRRYLGSAVWLCIEKMIKSVPYPLHVSAGLRMHTAHRDRLMQRGRPSRFESDSTGKHNGSEGLKEVLSVRTQGFV